MPTPTETEIAAFIRARGVTRCPTACAAPTQASGSDADQAALRQRAERLEALRQQRLLPVYSRKGWSAPAKGQAAG
jgi:hypothetical protein